LSLVAQNIDALARVAFQSRHGVVVQAQQMRQAITYTLIVE